MISPSDSYDWLLVFREMDVFNETLLKHSGVLCSNVTAFLLDFGVKFIEFVDFDFINIETGVFLGCVNAVLRILSLLEVFMALFFATLVRGV